MPVRSRFYTSILVMGAVVFLVLAGGRAGTSAENTYAPPPGPFSPSNASTADGRLIPTEQFFPAARCAKCHSDIHADWSESLHRNAGREPFYKESVEILEQTRGGELAQHCESCHSPTAVFSGALRSGTSAGRELEDEGVTCSVCHSVTEVRLEGTGSYTVRRPALLVRPDGTPVTGDVPDKAIMADIPGHRRAVMRPLLKTPEFCSACHKSVAPPSLNGYKFLRGFSTYDEWQQSGASRETVTPYYRRPERTDCRSCHMPRVAALKDLAAKQGEVTSHRWLGANTAAPLFYGQSKQVELTAEFLRSNVLSVDIFALRGAGAEPTYAPLDSQADNPVAFQPGDEVTAEVVVFNRRAAHSFPPELRDMYEPWVEFEALDSTGRTLFHSGFIKPDRTLDESAHTYKSILLDDASRVITRHQVWLARIKAYDNFIPPGRSDIARFRFRLPPAAVAGDRAVITLRATVNYRRFIQEYTDYVLRRRNATTLNVPVVQMARAETRVVFNRDSSELRRVEPVRAVAAPPGQDAASQSRRWNDYGIGLMEQAQYEAAAAAFRRAGELNPKDPDPLVSAAAAELKTERYGPERDQLRKAAALLDAALNADPTSTRARFYRALLWRSQGKARETADELADIASRYPRDREVQRQLGQTLYGLGRLIESRAAFEAVLAIDPNDAGAYDYLSSIYAGEGRRADAERARALYLLWRDDPLADRVAARFFASYPQWADERILSHAHGETSPLRQVLTGELAAPVR